MTLSIVIPCYNEAPTLVTLVQKVLAQPYPKEVIIIDDGSTDGSTQIIAKLATEYPEIKSVRLPQNHGKGSALKAGFAQATGDIVLIQDADLEYDPMDYPILIEPILHRGAHVVYGSRFLGGVHRVLYFWHSVANFVLTLFSNIITDLNLTDMETGYKAFRRDIIQRIDLEERRFGIEPEMTVKLALIKGICFYEVPISYDGRTYQEGKKIGWKDAVRAIVVLIKYGVIKRRSYVQTLN